MTEESLITRVSRSMFWNIVAFPLSMLLNAAATVYIIRYLGDSKFGIFTLLTSTINTITVYSSLGISRSLTRFLPEFKKSQDEIAKAKMLLRYTLILRLIIIAVSIAILNLHSSFFIHYFKLGAKGSLYIKIISIAVIFTSLYELATYLLHSLFRQKEVNIIALLVAFIQPILLITFILLGLDITGILIALVLTNMVACGLSWYWGLKALPKSKLKMSFRKLAAGADLLLKRFFSYSFIIYLFDMSKYFRDVSFASLIIMSFYGADGDKALQQVAFFAAGYKLADFAVKFLVSASRGVFTPMLAEVYAERDQEKLQKVFWNASKFQVLISIPAAFGLMTLAGDLIPILFGEDFLSSINIAYVFISFLFFEILISFPSTVLLTYERYKYVILSRIIPIIGIPLLILGTKLWGIIGTAFILGSLALLSRVAENYFTFSLFKLKYPFKFLCRIAIASAIFTVILRVIHFYIIMSPYKLGILIVLAIIIFIVAFKLLGGFSREEKEIIEKSSIPLKNIILKIT
jgi:O-antigen/teichoic acid export membrane protein